MERQQPNQDGHQEGPIKVADRPIESPTSSIVEQGREVESPLPSMPAETTDEAITTEGNHNKWQYVAEKGRSFVESAKERMSGKSSKVGRLAIIGSVSALAAGLGIYAKRRHDAKQNIPQSFLQKTKNHLPERIAKHI